MTNEKKSVDYLRENHIMQDDEDFILEIPLGMRSRINSKRFINWNLIIFLILAFSVVFLYALALVNYIAREDLRNNHILLVIGLLAGVGMLKLGDYIYAKIKSRENINIHHFITSKRIYSNSDIKNDPYTHINIDDLISIEIMTKRTEITITTTLGYTAYYLKFTQKDQQTKKIEITKLFATSSRLENRFPNPDLITYT